MPSEQPREGTREPGPYLRCPRCDQYLPGDLADRENIGNPEVLCGPACCEPAQPQPRGGGDDLAARLDGDRLQDAITIAYHRNNERGFRDALALTPRAERTTKDSQAAYDLGYEEGRKVRQSLVYNIQEAPNEA